METELICGKTMDEIRGMRAKHGHVMIVEVKDEDACYKAVVKEPTRQVLECVTAVSKDNETKGAMALYDNCVLLADDEIKRRDILKLQVAGAIGDKIGKLGAVAKNV